MYLSLPSVFLIIGENSLQITEKTCEICSHFIFMQTITDIFCYESFHKNITPKEIRLVASLLILLCVHIAYKCLQYTAIPHTYIYMCLDSFDQDIVKRTWWTILDRLINECISLLEKQSMRINLSNKPNQS